MAAPTSFRRLAVALLLASAPAGSLTPVAAVDAIPAEQGGERLPEATVTAIVGDVDRDAVRELIRIGPLADDETHLGVEVISADAAGQLSRHGMVPFRRLAGVEEQTEGQAVPDDRGMVAARIDEPARLLVWKVRGEERVLLVSIGTQDNPRPCCLTIAEVGLDRSGQTTVAERAAISRSASYVRAADLDGDGTDELAVAEPMALSDPGVTQIYVLRWVGDRFVRLEGALPVQPGTEVGEQLLSLGDSDGRPGEEVGLLSGEGSPPGASLDRISLTADGALRLEQTRMPFAGPLIPVATSEGGRLLVGTPAGDSALLAWPAGERTAIVERRSERRGVPVAALGTASGVRVLAVLNGVLEQMDGQLGAIGSTPPASSVAVFGGVSDLAPYVGPLPGGVDGSAAFIFGGGVLTAPSPSGLLIDPSPVATMVATTPIGTFGPGGLLIALAEGGFDATREGGHLLGPAGPRPGLALTTALTEVVLSSEVDDGQLEPLLTGTAMTDRGVAAPLLLTRGDARARVTAPPGSRVMVFENDAVPGEPLIVPVDGVAEVALLSGGTQARVHLVVITPSGHGYAATWAIRVATAPPPLEASVPAASFGFSVRIQGRTAPDARVTVDGMPVAVAADGTFAVDVGAGLLPQQVEIRAVDAIGNEATQRVSVVGPFDYRQLPWIPIVAALTIVAGLLLYLRAPRPSPQLSRPAGDDAVLEEIE